MASRGMITPFEDSGLLKGAISHGVSSYGYDMRLSDEYNLLLIEKGGVLDPKDAAGQTFKTHKGDHCIIPGNSFVLARSLEYFKVPRDVLIICLGKSTYARCGVVVNVTPLEPQWEGHLTLAIINTSPLPVKIYSNEGIAQLIFLGCDEVCEVSYADRSGKYQGQDKITLSKL